MAHGSPVAALKYILMRAAYGFLVICALGLFAQVAQAAVVEVYSLTSPNSTLCGNTFICDDSAYTLTDAYTVLTDGSTSTGIDLKNGSVTTQDTALKVIFALNTFKNGTYILMPFWESSSAGTLHIATYDSFGSVNGSSVITEDVDAGNPRRLQVDVSSLIFESIAATGRVEFRLFISEGSSYGINEISLVPPISVKDYRILQQGVSTTAAINESIESSWKIVMFDSVDYAIDNITCVVEDVNGVIKLTDEYINATWDVYDESVRVRWLPDPDRGFEEMHNYRVSCDATAVASWGPVATSANLKGFEQYVYITADVTILDKIAEIWNSLLQVLGIVQENQAQINATRDIANGTLQIAQVLELSTAGVDVIEAEGMPGEQIVASAYVTTAEDTVVGSNCSLTTHYPNASVWLDSVTMTDAGDGLYTRTVILPNTLGTMRATVVCTDGPLGVNYVRGSGTWRMLDGVWMEMIA